MPVNEQLSPYKQDVQELQRLLDTAAGHLSELVLSAEDSNAAKRAIEQFRDLNLTILNEKLYEEGDEETGLGLETAF